MRVVVTGIGLISALGDLAATWNALLQGRTGIAIHQPFDQFPSCPIGLINLQPSRLASLTQQVVHQALQDAGLEPPMPDCAIVLGSSRGNQARWEEMAITPTDLTGWWQALPHAGAILAAQLVGTQAAVRSPMAACATGLWAIAQGYDLIRAGYADRVIAGAVEAPITLLTLVGFERMGALAQRGAYPFDRQREGLVLGEGGAVLVLESADLAQRRGAKIYGQIVGVGLTADGYHVSAPDPQGQSASTAVQQCLRRSGLQPRDIGYIHAHGTATQLNDRNEANLIRQLFPANLAVSSTKGATGHTIGASGALGAAFCLMALQQQVLPPCIGLREPEFALNFLRQAQPTRCDHTLCLSFGFGGQNAAIAFRKGDPAVLS